jgi:hypothetical protein
VTRVIQIATLFAGLCLSVRGAAEPVRPVQNPAPQQQYPAVRPHSVAREPEDLAVQAVHNFGACVVALTPQGARATLALDYRMNEYKAKLRAVAEGHSEHCNAAWWRLRFNPTLFAGAMAEALLKSDIGEAQLPRRLAYDPNRQEIVARSPLETMALCTAVRAPDLTAALFATEPASADEASAMQPLFPVLQQCLANGTKASLNKPALRSLLALAAWRIATTPRKAVTQ